jgi:hypothetical protein
MFITHEYGLRLESLQRELMKIPIRTAFFGEVNRIMPVLRASNGEYRA